jgi:sugar phosphate isomerase/epimerase
MYLALNSVLVNGRVPWPEFARLASTTGYLAVDLMLTEARKQGLEKTRKLLADLNVVPAVADLPVEFRKDDETFKAGLPGLEEAAPFISALQCPRMITWIMSSMDQPADEVRRVFKRRFTDVATILARSHVRLGLEFLGPLHIRKEKPYEFIWRMNDMLEFAKECGSNVGLLLDAWHWHHAGATKDDILRAGAERIVHIHFDDAAPLPPEQVRDNERLMPGDGVIDLVGFLQSLQAIGYHDALSIEIFGKFVHEMTPENAAKMGLSKARAVFAKAGIKESIPALAHR